MNQANNYIKEKLRGLHNRFFDMKIRYEFNEGLNIHLIEVLPLSLYEGNQEYILAEMELEEEFHSLFPQEEILFVSTDSLNQVENPDYRLGYNDTFSYRIESIDTVVMKDVEDRELSEIDSDLDFALAV